MCWAQHFTLDIPPVPLHSGAHRVQAKERIAHIFTGTQPGPPSHLPTSALQISGSQRANIAAGGGGGGRRGIFQQTGDIGSRRFPF